MFSFIVIIIIIIISISISIISISISIISIINNTVCIWKKNIIIITIIKLWLNQLYIHITNYYYEWYSSQDIQNNII